MRIPYWYALLLLVGCSPRVKPLVYGHAHNDYEHSRPLFEALDNGFVSVEADVYVIGEKLYVSHDVPKNLDTTLTLEELYLDPLVGHIQKRDGNVYKRYREFFYLMIDIKTSAHASYPVLRKALANYAHILSVVTDSVDQHNKPVKVFLSGFEGRPVEQLFADTIKYAGLDGRPEELGKGIPAAFMPVISQHYSQYLSWSGEGTPDPRETYRLRQLIEAAHREGKMVRLWASPDIPAVWTFLLKIGVDLINTDKLPELRTFCKDQERPPSSKNL